MSRWTDMLSQLVSPLPKGPQNAYPLSTGTQGSTLYELLTSGNLSSAGYPVTERTAMGVSAVYACVSLIAGAIASMPIHIYAQVPGGREKVDATRESRASDLWWLLNEQASPVWAAAPFWEYMTGALLLNGDAFARLVRTNGGDTLRIVPLHPDCVTVEKLPQGAGLRYKYLEDGAQYEIPQADMLHIPGIGFDGMRGMSAIRYAAKNAIGTALAAEEYSGKFFQNGARPDFLISVKGAMDATQQERFREQWGNRFGGPARSHLPAIMTGEADIKPLTLNAEDAQLIETRKFQVIDIARIFGVPPFMIGETEKQSSWGSGVESMGIGFVKYTLQRHLTKFEQEINRKCFPKSLRWFCEFQTAGLERGDLKSRYEAHRVAIGRAGEPGFLTVNEARRIENLPPIDGGDKLMTIEPQPAERVAA